MLKHWKDSLMNLSEDPILRHFRQNEKYWCAPWWRWPWKTWKLWMHLAVASLILTFLCRILLAFVTSKRIKERGKNLMKWQLWHENESDEISCQDSKFSGRNLTLQNEEILGTFWVNSVKFVAIEVWKCFWSARPRKHEFRHEQVLISLVALG